MRVLISGGAGLVGSHLCDRIIAEGHHVVAVDNFTTGRQSNIAHLKDHEQFELIDADLTQSPTLPACDQIYHLASPASPKGYLSNPIATHLVNSVGTKYLLDLAREWEARFLFTSTSEIYGDPQVHPQPESYFGNVNPVGPRSCYDESKRFGESITMEYVRQFDLDARIVRLFNVYGPRNDPNDGRVIPEFIRAALRDEPLPIYGDGSQTRSLCYISDLVTGLSRTMTREDLGGSIINLGNPDERTIMELAGMVRELCDSSSSYTYFPPREDDPIRRCPDIARARELLDWSPTTDLSDGLAATIEYFRKNEGITE